MHAIAIHRPGQPPERREITGPLRAGGSHADAILLPDCPPAALRLVPCAAGLVAEAVSFGVRVAGRPVPPGGRRLLQPGERVELHGSAIALERGPAGDGTRAAAGALLRDAAAGAMPVAGPHLVVLSGDAAGSRHPLRGELTLGRGRGASVRIPDAQASRVHARIRIGRAGATVEDLGSKNGVRVNGVRIDGRPCPLRAGDELVIGETALAVQDLAPGARPASADAPPRAPRRVPPPHLVAAALLALSAAALVLAAG
jgi:FHA domain